MLPAFPPREGKKTQSNYCAEGKSDVCKSKFPEHRWTAFMKDIMSMPLTQVMGRSYVIAIKNSSLLKSLTRKHI
jgi:hypothetical protein